MPAPLSTHLPQVSGDIVNVLGTLDVDTGLRDLQTASVNLMGALVANEEATVTWEKLPLVDGATQMIRIRVYKGGTGSGTLGDTSMPVSWSALGR